MVARLFPGCYLQVIGNKREQKNQEYLKIIPLSVKLMTNAFHLILSGNQYVLQNHLTVVGSVVINIHENRIGLIILTGNIMQLLVNDINKRRHVKSQCQSKAGCL